MSERGFIAVDRGIFEHTFFQATPLSEREAWLWLIAEAAWEPAQKRIGSTTFSLERGQIVHSLRFLANAWKWTDSRVRRFLARLKEAKMIDATATQPVTQITICNYEIYQDSRRTRSKKTDAAATQTKQANNKQSSNEDLDNRDERVIVLSAALDADHAQAVHEHRLIKGGRSWTPRAAALIVKEINKVVEAGLDPNEAAEAIIRNNWQGFEADWFFRSKRSSLRVIPGQGPPKPKSVGQRLADRMRDFGNSDIDQFPGRTIDEPAYRR